MACVFSARQWLDSRPLTQKQFVDVMVRSIARKASPTQCQLCECIADQAQVGVSVCRSCHRQLPFILVSTSSLTKTFQTIHQVKALGIQAVPSIEMHRRIGTPVFCRIRKPRLLVTTNCDQNDLKSATDCIAFPHFLNIKRNHANCCVASMTLCYTRLYSAG